MPSCHEPKLYSRKANKSELKFNFVTKFDFN
jgi:hypothetical protein